MDQTDSNTSELIKNNKQILILGLFFGFLSAVVSMSMVLGIVSSVPFIYAYYRHGESVFWVAGMVGIVLVFILNIYTKNTIPINPSSTVIDSLPIDSNQANDISKSFINSNSYYYFIVLEFAMRIIGIWCILKFSKFSWFFRLLLGVSFLIIGTLPIFNETKELTFQMFSIDEHEMVAISTIISFLLPVIIAALLMVNWIIATLILCFRLKLNYINYLEYVYNKILFEYKKKSLLLLVTIGIGVFLTKNAQDGFYSYIYIFAMAILMMLVLKLIIVGFVYGYFYLQGKMKLRADWYLFFICIIMLVPLINLPIIALFLLVGMWFDWKKNNLAHKERGVEDESNS